MGTRSGRTAGTGTGSRVLTLALIALALGCVGPGTSVTEAEIGAARDSGTLEDLYGRVLADFEAEGARPSPHTVAMKARIGTILGEQAAAAIEATLEDARREDGLVPLGVLENAKLRVPDVAYYDEARAERMEERVDVETRKTEEAIEAAIEAREALPDDAVTERIARTRELLELVAPGSDRAIGLEAERDGMLGDLATEVDQAILAEDYEEAGRMARLAAEIAPQNASVQEQIVTIDSKRSEQEFWKHLEEGDTNAAYRTLREASKADNFDGVQRRLAPYADKMADAFVELAAGATEQGDLAGGYRGFHQAREIRSLLGATARDQLPAEAAFVETIKKRYWDARKAEQHGLAWAYLSVVEELEPMSPSLRRMVRETREQVEQAAVKRLAALPFQNTGNGHDFGEAVSSKVIQYLFESIPDDIRIIERKQLEDILREKELGAEAQVLASADYIVQGDIQEAKVESTEKAGRKTVRVVTETVTEPNPLYEKWVGLSAKDREDVPKPAEQITRDVKEDVSVEMTVHRKVGVFSVSYRVVDANSAKVIFADSLHEKAEHEDTSTEGVELGNFKREFKLASLPSDLEILQQLSDRISAEIGKRLAEVLKDPELRYDEAGQRFIAEGNYAKASESLAYAHVLASRKGKDVDEIGERLRESAVLTLERGSTG